MRTLRLVFVVSALTCGLALLLKMVAIAATGGADTESVVVAVLYLAGMVAYLATAATGAALLLRRAAPWARVVAGLVAVPVAFMASNALDAAVKAVHPVDGWFGDEIALVIIAVACGALGLRMLARRTREPSAIA